MRTGAVLAAMIVPAGAWAQQQPAPQMPGMAPPVAPAAVTECAQAHPMAERTIDVANQRLEAARQANSPAAMRAAVDDMQAALRQLRTQIAPCAGLQLVAAADPQAGHVMPGTAQPTPAAAAPAAPMDHSKMPRAGNASAGNPAAAVGAKPAPAAPMDHSKMPMGGPALAGTPGTTTTGRKPAAQPRAATPAVAKPPAAGAGHDMANMPGHNMANMNAGASSSATTLDLPTRPQDLACATKVDPKTAPRAAFAGKTYYLCSAAERDRFVKAPAAYRPKQ